MKRSMLSHEWGRHANPYWVRVFYALDGLQVEAGEIGTRRWLELSEAKEAAVRLAYGCPKPSITEVAA